MAINQQLTIKILEQSDIEQILKIAEECNLAIWSRQDYRAEIKRKNSFLAGAVEVENENLVGFIAVRFHIAADKAAGGSEADILNIGLLENYREKGIGGLLLDRFLAKALELKIKNVWLEVRKSNSNARHFYRQRKFMEIRERRNFYTQPLEDAVVMKLELVKT